MKLVKSCGIKSVNPARLEVSIFAIAPQPLLILLGSLLTELHDVDIYQRHRINNTWIWPIDNGDKVEFKILEPI